MARKADTTVSTKPQKANRTARSRQRKPPSRADALQAQKKYKPRRDRSMLNEQERLLECMELLELLMHYMELGKEDRDAWQDRLMEFNGLQGRDLTRLYGELLAHGWLEQNTGDTPILEAGRHACCYRITAAGRRAFKEVKEEMVAG